MRSNNWLNKRNGGFFEYIAAVVVVILILVGLRVDIRRYGEEHHITNFIQDSREYVQEKIVSPVVWFWTDRMKPFLEGKTFSKLGDKLREDSTLKN